MKKAILPICLTVILSGCSYGKDFNKSDFFQTKELLNYTEQPNYDKTEDSDLIISSMPEKYTYDNLLHDVAELQRSFGTLVQPVEVCETSDGRTVCDIIIGDQQGENQILIIGAMHAREYITTQLVMSQLCDCIYELTGKTKNNYMDIPKKKLLNDITIHFIPMSNPDGVSISQFGLDGIYTSKVKQTVMGIGSSDYEQWKANADGVDINRNFDAGWYEYQGAGIPASERYKGEFPGSSNEADGLIKLTYNYKFKRTISYHTCGALIYWYYKQTGGALEESERFAKQISDETGYTLDDNYQAVDAAGYKDWAVYRLGIPSLTIEVGNETGKGIINPVPISCFKDVWERNKNVVYAAIYNLKYGS